VLGDFVHSIVFVDAFVHLKCFNQISIFLCKDPGRQLMTGSFHPLSATGHSLTRLTPSLLNLKLYFSDFTLFLISDYDKNVYAFDASADATPTADPSPVAIQALITLRTYTHTHTLTEEQTHSLTPEQTEWWRASTRKFFVLFFFRRRCRQCRGGC